MQRRLPGRELREFGGKAGCMMGEIVRLAE